MNKQSIVVLNLFLVSFSQGCKKRSHNDGKIEAARKETIESRFGPNILLRDLERLPSAEQKTAFPKGLLNNKGFVVGEEVPIKGISLLTSTSSDQDAFDAENAAGEKVRVKRIDAMEPVKMKQGGWWVTPIHATLIAETGEVLLTGWGRQDRDRGDSPSGLAPVCDVGSQLFHSGKRRYGVTFKFDPNVPIAPGESTEKSSASGSFVNDKSEPDVTYLVKGIHEAVNASESSFERQVYYCAGHVPLPDGKIFYTGGSKYRNLGASGMHRELIRYKKDGKVINVEFDPKNAAQAEILKNAELNGAKVVIESAPELDEVEFGVDYPKIFDPKSAPNPVTGRQSFVALTNLGYLGDLGPDVSSDASIPGFQRINTMWYPTNTRLPASRILTIAGTYRWSPNRDIANRSMQIFDYRCFLNAANCSGKSVWIGLSRHDYTPQEIAPGIRDYIHSFLLPKPILHSCGGKKAKEYHVAVSGWPGKVFLVDTESEINANTARNKEEAAARFCEAPEGQRPAGANSADGAQGWSSSSALIYTGEILRMGGYFDPRVAQRVDLYNPYASQGCVNFKELSGGKIKSCSSYRFINTAITRESPATVLLPDGKVLVTNGWDDGQSFEQNSADYSQAANARTRIQIIDPALGLYDANGEVTGELFSQPFAKGAAYFDIVKSVEQSLAVFSEAPWTDPSLSADARTNHKEINNERGYHNIALLLKDGRVLLGGGTHVSGNVGCERPSMQIYSPPYLDHPEKRPVYSRDYKSIEFVVGSRDPIVIKYKGDKLFPSKASESSFGKSGVVLMAPGAFTHGFNQNQRYVGLEYKTAKNQTDQLFIYPPKDEFVSPEGEYLMFLVSESGVPSVGLKVVVKGKKLR